MANKLLASLDITKIMELTTRKLHNQEQTLKNTLAEIELVESLETGNPGAYTGALIQLRTKRDRQHGAAAMTGSYLSALAAAKAPRKP